MNQTDFILSIVKSFGGEIQGRTLLQKRAFFAATLSGVDPGLRFDAHFYGPYSSTVDNTVARLNLLGFLEEENTGFGFAPSGFEIRRYDYRLTEDGEKVCKSFENLADFRQVKVACERIIAAGNPDYLTLSIAAKAFFILRKRPGKGMSRDELIREAKKFDWNIDPNSLENAVRFLDRLNLVRKTDA
jgi:uncharacterized protein YwgA